MLRQALLAEVRRAAAGGGSLPNQWLIALSPSDARRRRKDLDDWRVQLAQRVVDEAWTLEAILSGPATVTFTARPELSRGNFRITGSRDPDAVPARLVLPEAQPRLVVPAGGTTRWGTPASAGLERALPLPVGGSVIGRGHDVDLRLHDASVSPHHARVDVSADGSEVCIRDLGSETGTRVDGRPVSSATLVDGSRLQFGGVTLVFRRSEQDDGGRQGGGPHRREVSGADDVGATSGTPLGAGPFMAGLRRTPKGLWLAVLLMVLGLALVGGAVVALSRSPVLAAVLVVLGVAAGVTGVALGRRHGIMDDVT